MKVKLLSTDLTEDDSNVNDWNIMLSFTSVNPIPRDMR